MEKKTTSIISKMDPKKMVASFFLAIYTWILMTLQTISVDLPISIIYELFLAGLCIVLSYIVVEIVGNYIKDIVFLESSINAKKYGLIAFFVLLCMSFICLLAFYPGGITDDTINQFEQAMGIRQYSNWHPAIHTFLFFTIPLSMGPYISLILLYQIIFYSAVMGYLFYVLVSHGLPKYGMILFMLYMLVNPYVLTYLMFPWKDIAFMIFSIWVFAYYIQIVCSNGEWLKKRSNFVLFVTVLGLCFFMRHNASLFVVPLLLVVIFYVLKENKVRIKIVGAFLLVVILVKALYAIVGVEDESNKTVEVIGVPINVWCNVMQKNPEALPDDTRDVMLTFADIDVYQNQYTTGSFNGMKSSGYVDIDRLNALSLPEALDYTLQCFKYAPNESWEALVKLTDLVWDTDGKCIPCVPIVVENDYGFTDNSIEWAYEFIMTIILFFTDGMGAVIFGSFGFMMLIELVVSLALFSRGRKSIVHIIPVFCYNFGTMLMLSGEDYRLFLITIPLTIPSIFLMLKDKKAWEPN